MSTLEMILIAIGLAMDASAVSMTAAAAGFVRDLRAVFRLAFHFGLFQAVMPFIGWLLGSTVVDYISAWDHWVAFALLAIVGGRMIYSGMVPDEKELIVDPSRGWVLITLSIATSIDALAAGLSFSVLNVNIWLPCLLIGIITFILSALSTQIGRLVGPWLGQKVEILGGFILMGIGLRILVTHLS
ncbi:MAG: manganese efflux pump [Candidatus Marinimicrobia bacterium]|jgi:putative Mn2+ efflux pump MntP|nr:manganese efflux pump [Candidatus Neomarinimicrobiota bacterium]MBT3574515.1 manganese efflux pump [Candidatus Neomarinimicrobiota bacterium]MBT3679786.1 manganese efflux pump [Candidatus Neomarinimicrobiota bacterium]MBT3950457.1 manganese efflux pump [Candidatus Neomarinimicrobiota bacterium]MBT4253955.1 manganese efflux pump [Candidatus Neomarinimicrobiota bacterium]